MHAAVQAFPILTPAVLIGAAAAIVTSVVRAVQRSDSGRHRHTYVGLDDLLDTGERR